MLFQTFMSTELADRLTDAREAAGYKSAKAAALAMGIKPSTYGHHESGQRSPGPEECLQYASHFGTNACWLMFGAKAETVSVAGIASEELHLIITRVLSYDEVHKRTPKEIADLIVDLCRYAGKSGMTGMDGAIDFQMHRRERQRG